MNGLCVFLMLLIALAAGLEAGAPGITIETVALAAQLYTSPELPAELAAAIAAKTP